MKIARDSVVSFEYKLTSETGEVLDESLGEPLVYLHGRGQIVPGLERALEGQQEGAKLSVTVELRDGYGERSGAKVIQIPRAEFPEDEPLEAGMSIEAVANDGRTVTLWVVEESEDTVGVSLDHPLAGVTLNFHVEICGVRAASSEELTHGHAHGPDGHDHGPNGHDHGPDGHDH